MTNAREFSSRLLGLLRREQSALAEFLLALADFDARRLWLELGYTSLFHFLHRELGMSKGAAHYRKTAAELVRRVPEVVEPLRDGRLCITSIIELAKVLTPENREEVLPRFFHRSRQEAKAVSAELCPAAEALSHSHPGAEVEEILEAGLDLLLDRAAKRKGLVERPRTKALPPPPAGSRSLPASVKREVWLRDEGRCQWRLENGEKCGSTRRLEFDHVHPVALGGESTVGNTRVLCSAHNLMAARRSFGDALMERYAPVRRSGAAAGAR